MVTRQQALKTGKELHDLAKLLVDETPNNQQITEFITEGFQAVNVIRETVIPADKRDAVLANVAEGFLHENNTTNPRFMLPEA